MSEKTLETYRRMWLDQITKAGEAESKLENIRALVTELYYASFWDSDRLQPDTAGYLWNKIKTEFEFNEPGPKRIIINDPAAGD